MCDYYFVCGVQRNCGSSRHFAMCCTLQKFARHSSSVFIFFSFKWHCKLLITTLLIKKYTTIKLQNSTHDSKDIFINSAFLLIIECKLRSFYYGKLKIKDKTILSFKV